MNTTSHKTIWRIAAGFAVIAGIVVLLRGEDALAPYESPTLDDAMVVRDAQIAELHRLLETDWRMRRIPTRRAVEQVSAYAQHPTLATAETYYALALFRYYADEDPDSAQAALSQAIALDPDWSWPYGLKGVIQFSEGDRVNGLKSLHHAMALDPDWSRPYSDLAILYRIEENWEVALDYAQIAMDMYPDDPIPYFNYGVILDYKGDHDAASGYYEIVLEMNAELPAPYYNMACGFARKGEVEDSLRYLKVSIGLDPAFHKEATKDRDFDTIREDPEFIDFMENNAP